MITQKQLPAVLHHPVYGSGGQKIGEASHVFCDDATGQPEWVTVKTGVFGGNEPFVPIHDAVLADGHLEVPYSKDKIKAAPKVTVDAGGHLSANEEHRLYDFYGIDWDAALQHFAGQQPTRGQATGPGQQQAATIGRPVAGRHAMGQRPAREHQAGAGAAAGVAGDAMTRSEETMHVGVERHETSRARLRKYVVTEEQEQTVPLRHEEARLVREPITEANRGDALSEPEISEAEHEVTLHAEKPVVKTRVEPKERVRLEVAERTEQTTVRGQVRKEQIALEETGEDRRD